MDILLVLGSLIKEEETILNLCPSASTLHSTAVISCNVWMILDFETFYWASRRRDKGLQGAVWLQREPEVLLIVRTDQIF